MKIVNASLMLCLLLAGLLLPCATAQNVNFDTRPSVACKDVTPEQFHQNNPTVKIVEARFRISADLEVDENKLDFIKYKLTFPAGVTVQDYLPKTMLDSAVASPIQVSSENRENSGYQISMNADASVNYVIGSATVGANGSYQSSKMADSGVQISYLPPKQLVMAAGTENRGSSLWWKLKPMSQVTLEGEKEFVALIEVPANWQGSQIILKCSQKLNNEDEFSVKEMKIGLYTYGDNRVKAQLEKDALNSSDPQQIQIAAIRLVLSQDHGLASKAKSACSQITTDSFNKECDQLAAIYRDYTSKGKEIDMSACPRDFAEAYNRFLSAYSDVADVLASHPYSTESFGDAFAEGLQNGLSGKGFSALFEKNKNLKNWSQKLTDAKATANSRGQEVAALAVHYGAK